MEHRVVVGLEPGADWLQLKNKLLKAGADRTTEPVSYQPDAVVATLAGHRDVAKFISHVRTFGGVRYVEPDTMSGTF